MNMFCYQCEQAAKGIGCNITGTCGKTPETAGLQDVIVYIVKGIAQYAHRARQLGSSDIEIDRLMLEALFTTLTNVNFDTAEHVTYINGELSEALNKARAMYLQACKNQGVEPEAIGGPATWQATESTEELHAFARARSIMERASETDPDILSLQEMLTYGVKGLVAYAHHARLLGYEDESVYAFVHEAMHYLTTADQDMQRLLQYCLDAGKVNLTVMAMLDKAHTETFGHPVPTPVRIKPVAGKAIVISGHDLKSLEELLKQTEGKGINIYTHGEMLPAHGYPGLKKYKHLVANYGSAWQNQVTEFADFPGAIVMTTNCLKPPAASYVDRLFTMDVVGFSDVRKLKSYDYSPVIEAALKAPGFPADEPEQSILVGFGHNAVLGVADKVIDAVKAGKIKHFFLVGGCDGAEMSRNYFTEFVEETPADTVILTLGCGKYRFNYMDLGDIDGIPRLLDLGQCNDSYSAVKIAGALAEAFGCGINDLPLSLVISWFEQKAVAVLLTLLYLGVKNIRLGPNLPAFVSPNILKALVDGYGLKPVGKVSDDLRDILQPAGAAT